MSLMGTSLILYAPCAVKDFVSEGFHCYIPLGFAVAVLIVVEIQILIDDVDIDVGVCAAQNGYDVPALDVDDYL